MRGDHICKMATVSLWSCVSKMPPEHFEKVYHEFPRNMRGLLGEWLEDQPWEFIDENDHSCTELAGALLQKLVEELERLIGSGGTDGQWPVQFMEPFKQICLQNPMKIVEIFRNILEGETMVVLKQHPRLKLTFSQKQENIQFNFHILILQNKIKGASILQQQLKRSKENLSFLEGIQGLAHLQTQWMLLVKEAFDLLVNVQYHSIKKLNMWKRQQQMAGYGAPFDENLIPLQESLETVFAIYCELDRTVKDMIAIGEQVPPELLEQINESLGNLVKSSLLVDKQPPQVLKTQTKFQASVNFLLGFRLLGGVTKMPTVKATIITERRAQELSKALPNESWNDGSGDIENGKSTLEITPTTRTCGAVFKNMLLKKIKRCERKGSESVTEEKCAILFVAEINLNSSNVTYVIQALSMPVVVIVHGNQDNNAKATILWDNAFAEVERRPFFVEERVPWAKMCQTLNLKFVSEVGSKQGLLKEHFVFLAQKIFNENSLNEDDFKDRTVSWAQFNKEPLRERNFTFWQWFDGVVDLTKRCLKNYWSDRLITGFISKQFVHKVLSTQPDGTFLLRFSDSEIGGITIAYVVRGSGIDGFAQIQNIQPFTAKDLQILSLGDRVRDLKVLKYLHKDKPKDEAFEKYYTKKTSNLSGYVPAKITIGLDGDNDSPQSNPFSVSGFEVADACEVIHNPSPNALHPSLYPHSPANIYGPDPLINVNVHQSPDAYNPFITQNVYPQINPYGPNIRFSGTPPSYPLPAAHVSPNTPILTCEPMTDMTETSMDESNYLDSLLDWDWESKLACSDSDISSMNL
uniref:Signal transducer and activator of transcription n=1 Tax=Leptobrachium leishanense TaxID=445787 RepID=A0A8C5MGU2_9ANUR